MMRTTLPILVSGLIISSAEALTIQVRYDFDTNNFFDPGTTDGAAARAGVAVLCPGYLPGASRPGTDAARDEGDPRRLATPGGLDQLGGWFWKSGYDKSSINDFELIRDLNFRSMYGAQGDWREIP